MCNLLQTIHGQFLRAFRSVRSSRNWRSPVQMPQVQMPQAQGWHGLRQSGCDQLQYWQGVLSLRWPLPG
jgi:hypothetical protein